jgi:hypothetical protein
MKINAGIGFGTISDGILSVELTVPVPTNNTNSSQTKWINYGDYYIYFIPQQANGNYDTASGRIFVGSDTTPQKCYKQPECSEKTNRKRSKK